MGGNTDRIYDLDAILLELGNFGPFQIKNYFLLTIPIFASALYTISFVFTAANPQYRFVLKCICFLYHIYSSTQ